MYREHLFKKYFSFMYSLIQLIFLNKIQFNVAFTFFTVKISDLYLQSLSTAVCSNIARNSHENASQNASSISNGIVNGGFANPSQIPSSHYYVHPCEVPFSVLITPRLNGLNNHVYTRSESFRWQEQIPTWGCKLGSSIWRQIRVVKHGKGAKTSLIHGL